MAGLHHANIGIMNKIAITTVTPVYSGRNFLPELIVKIEQVRDRWRNTQAPLELIEAIFVNDASEDGSLPVLYEIQKTRPWVNVINLSRNFGQHQATIAGILHSSGDWVVTMDEDLQHDPSHIDTLLESAVKSDMDIIYANPEQSVHENPLRDWTSRAFKGLVSYATGNPHVREFNSFRLIRGSIARASGSVCSHGTYFDVALCWFSSRISSVKLPLKDVRFVESGKSGYTMRKLFSHARRMIVSSETKIVRFGAAIGFFAMFVAVVVGAKILFNKLFYPESIPVEGWTSLFLALMFFSGLLAILSGIVLEYISVILLHIQGKPTFFVVDRLTDRFLLDYYQDKKKK
jgi:glycosyltransferase involved in cell wall biosynthesis